LIDRARSPILRVGSRPTSWQQPAGCPRRGPPVPGATSALCYLVSRIGAPIDEPALALTRKVVDEDVQLY
jgi:hypothetical protein